MKGIMGRAAALGLLALSFSACDSKTVTAQNASTAEVAEKVKASGIADGGFISPGSWQMTTTVNSIDMPGMPPEMAKHMQANMGKPRSFEHCVTEEEAKKPKEGMFTGDQAKSCRYDSFTLGGGKVAMVMHCDNPGGKQSIKMNGTYSADAYRLTVASQVEGKDDTAMKGMTINATLDARRLGLCTGKEAN